MKPTDYAAQDAAQDEEMRKNAEINQSTEEPLKEGTPKEESLESPVEEANEPIVSEAEHQALQARYNESVKAMNKKMQEAAELRRRVAELEASKLETPERETEQKAEILPDLGGDSELMAKFRDEMEAFPELIDVIDELRAENSTLKAAVSNILADYPALKSEFSNLSSSYKSNLDSQNRLYWKTVWRALPDVDIQTLAVTPEFQAWRINQLPETEAMLVSDDPQDLIDGIKKYQTETGATLSEAPKKESQPQITAIEVNIKPDDKLAAAKLAATPSLSKSEKTGTTKPKFTREQIANMSQKEYVANEAAIDEAMARGEIE